MSALTEFLLARLAEDEAAAQRIKSTSCHGVESAAEADYFHFTDRVLADVEAKRRIVARCSAVDYAMPSTHLAHGILAELALPFADHPDYREEWKP